MLWYKRALCSGVSIASITLTLTLVFAGFAQQCDAGKKQYAHVWWASNSSWAVGGFLKGKVETLEKLAETSVPFRERRRHVTPDN